MKKTVILTEALVNKGGIEKEIVILKKYLDADIVSGIYDSDNTFPEFKKMHIKYFFRKKLPPIINTIAIRIKFSKLKTVKYDNLIFFGGHSLSAAKKDKNNIWICNAPIRYIYDCYRDTLESKHGIGKIFFNIFAYFLRKSDQKYFKNITKVLVNSRNVQKRVEKYYNYYNSQVVYPPVDTKKFKFLSQKNYYLLCSRLSPEKNVVLVTKAFELMPDKNLFIVGDGPLKSEIVNISNRNPNIQYLGSKNEDELAKIYGECIAAIYVSKKEDFGMVPVEAMAAGKPCIGANDGGMKETIIHGQTGLLIKQTVPEITKAVKTLTPKIALKMRPNCEKRAKDFKEELFVKSIVKHLK